MRWWWCPPKQAFSSKQAQAQAASIRAAWAEFRKQTEIGSEMGLNTFFRRSGLGEPFTRPCHFREELTISRTEEV